MKRLAATLATIGRIALPYFRSEDRWPGRILLGSVIGLELSAVAIHVILNYWYNGFYNTLQDTIDKCSAQSLEAVGRTLLHYLYLP